MNIFGIDPNFFKLFIACSDYFQIDKTYLDILLSIFKINDDSKVKFETYLEFYLYFKLSHNLSIEKKFSFIRKFLILIENYFYTSMNLSKEEIESKIADLRILFKIDGEMYDFFSIEISDLNQIEESFGKIDLIFSYIVNYFIKK